MSICVELDGIYCPKCNDLHPTLMWHDRYDGYATRAIQLESWLKNKKKRPALFGNVAFEDINEVRGLVEHDDPAPCFICGAVTHFTDAKTSKRVCSDECRAAAGYDFRHK